jgi:hypothetical protein
VLVYRFSSDQFPDGIVPVIALCLRTSGRNRTVRSFNPERVYHKEGFDGDAKITIDPGTRIEGHLKITCEIDDGRVSDAYSSGTMWRG